MKGKYKILKYYCPYCSEYFERKVKTKKDIIQKGNQIQCDLGHFISILDFE